MPKLPVLLAAAAALAAALACGDEDAGEPHGGGTAGAPQAGGGGRAGAGRGGSGAAAGASGTGGASDGSGGAEGGGGGDDSSSGSGGGAGDGGEAGGGRASAGEGGVGGAPAEECAVGSAVAGVFDERGGSLELCGAELTLVPGALAAERTVSLTLVELPPGAPAALEPGGPAFEVAVEGDLTTDAGAPLYVIVPHAATSRYVYLHAFADETWNYLEACTREDERIGQEAWTEGVFVALVETEDFPPSISGLGSGSVEVTFDGGVSTFDLDADTIETHAVYDRSETGRTVTLSATKEGPESSLERLRIDFEVDDGGDASLIQVTYGNTADVNGFWSYLPFHPAPAELALTRDEGEALAGSVSTELTQGEVVSPFSASFDVSVERYRYPPEGYCNLPEGDRN